MKWIDRHAIVAGQVLGIIVRLVVFALAGVGVLHLVGGWE